MSASSLSHMAVHCVCHTPTLRDQNMQGWFHCGDVSIAGMGTQ